MSSQPHSKLHGSVHQKRDGSASPPAYQTLGQDWDLALPAKQKSEVRGRYSSRVVRCCKKGQLCRCD